MTGFLGGNPVRQMGTGLTLIIQVLLDGHWALVKDTNQLDEYAPVYQAVSDLDLPRLRHFNPDGKEEETRNEDDILMENSALVRPFHHEYDVDYLLFGKLAGVRAGRCFRQPGLQKGFPSDVSEIFHQYLEWGTGDCHSVTYLSMAEIQQIDPTDLPQGTTTVQLALEYLTSIRQFQQYSQVVQDTFPDQQIRFILYFDS